MEHEIYIASAPGSLMLLGEHAVLHDKYALVCAVDKSIKVNLTLRDDQVLKIISDKFGIFETSLHDLNVKSPWQFVLTAIHHFHKNIAPIPCGFDLQITSEFSATVGLGSSAAITVATLSVLYVAFLQNMSMDKMQLFFAARSVIREVQGTGSGADVAASIFGGVIAYKMSPCFIEQIATHLPLVAVYSGSKVPTSEVVARVMHLHKKHPDILSLIFDAMDKCSIDAVAAIKQQNLRQLGELMNIHQGLQDALGVSNAILSDLIYALREHGSIFGAKISGSGLGDCVIGLGEIPLQYFPRNEKEKVLGVQQLNLGGKA